MNLIYHAARRVLSFIGERITPSSLACFPKGRILLHLLCACRDGKLRWHWHGILREILRVRRQDSPAGCLR